VLASEQIVAAVADLDPRSRALLELAPRRGLSDADMAALLRVRTADVERLRELAALQLAAALDLEADKLDVLQQELRRLDEADWERRAVLQGRRANSHGPPSRSRIVAGIAALLVVAVIAALLAPHAGQEKRIAPAAAAVKVAPRSGPAVAFERLNGTHGRGSVRLVRSPFRAHLRLRVAGFPRPHRGGYTVWLYNSPADVHRLAFTTFADFHGTLRLPRDFARYRFVDISRQVTDDRMPSGLSLLRALLTDLR
jgi:hypothetical protein